MRTTHRLVMEAAGTIVGDRISEKRLRLASALLFAAFGAAMLTGLS